MELASQQLEEQIEKLQTIHSNMKTSIQQFRPQRTQVEMKFLLNQANKAETALDAMIGELDSVKTKTFDELKKPNTNQRWLIESLGLQLQVLKAYYKKFANIKRNIGEIESNQSVPYQAILAGQLGQIFDKIDESVINCNAALKGIEYFYHKHKWVSTMQQNTCA